MKTNETALEAKEKEIKAYYAAQAEKEIEHLKLSFEVDGAKASLTAKHKGELKALAVEQAKQSKDLATEQAKEVKAFEAKYGVSFVPKAQPLSTNEKCKYVMALKGKDGVNKFSFNGTDVIGAKGEPIKSTIIFKDADGNKQSLSVEALKQFLR